jgi:hypothetical protein
MIDYMKNLIYIDRMSNNRLYLFLLFFVVAGTANVVHAELLHDQQVCEVCLHIHANDMADIASAPPQTISWDIDGFAETSNLTFFCYQLSKDNQTIRGPPQSS